ncbi:hypothetical protein B0H17DRAFT_1148768 [Mycena rosella]|uniref:Uncharacterized protein n=1 Tax=Mycena rosella TaxID=1033263 RepID=A0AAD7FTZ0_MYCRO|nr:hypothetical protein B0H17DRAFT_1148768 [Mycena rosella]
MVSANESFMQELVGPPPTDFPPARLLRSGKQCKSRHFYQMCMGAKEPRRLGTYAEQCSAEEGPRCPPRFAPLATQALFDMYETELAKFKLVNNSIDSIVRNVKQSQAALTALETATPVVWLPKIVKQLRKKLDKARQALDPLDSSALLEYPGMPDGPADNLGTKAKTSKATKTSTPAKTKATKRSTSAKSTPKEPSVRAAMKGKGKHKAPATTESVASEVTSDQLDEQPVLELAAVQSTTASEDPAAEEWLVPEGNDEDNHDQSGTIHAVVYTDADKLPAQYVLYVPNTKAFEFSRYQPATGRDLEGFSVMSEGYKSARDTLNLERRGSYMIYRERGLSPSRCPDIELWEQRALDSADVAEAKSASIFASSSQPASSQPTRSSGRTCVGSSSAQNNAFASSSKRLAEDVPPESTRVWKKARH